MRKRTSRHQNVGLVKQGRCFRYLSSWMTITCHSKHDSAPKMHILSSLVLLTVGLWGPTSSPQTRGLVLGDKPKSLLLCLLKSLCTDLPTGEENERRVFANLPPHCTPQQRYIRGESGLQETNKQR